MALVLKDRVKENTTTTGTGDVTLTGTFTGYQAFSVIGNANTTYYAIVSQVANEWEVGIGTYTLSGTSLSRNTVLSSSSLSSIAAIASISQSTTTVTVNTVTAHGITAGQVITVNAIANATALTIGTTATILTLGTTSQADWNILAGTVALTYVVGSTLTAAVSGSGITGTGTVTLNAQGTGKTVLTASGSILTYAGTSATYTAVTLLTGFAGVLTPFTAGNKDVFVTYPAERSVYADGLNIVADNAALTPVSSGGTGLSTLATGYIPYGNGTNPFSSGANLTYDGTTLQAGSVKPAAGIATVAPIVLTSGTNLTTAAAGAIEYDGVNIYGTTDTTSGRSSVGLYNQFKLTANGATISTTIANFFGATSNIALVAEGYYDIEIILYFLKTTAGTVTWTLTNSAAPTIQNIYYEMSPVTGIVAPPGTATMLVGQAVNSTAAYTVITGSLTTAVNHYARFRIQLDNGTGTSLKIQATVGTNTITPLAGSMWTARRLNTTNNGTYVA
jgi:hypothetical protein